MQTIYFLEIGNSKFIIKDYYLEEFMKAYDYEISGYDDVIEYAQHSCHKFKKIDITDSFEYEEI